MMSYSSVREDAAVINLEAIISSSGIHLLKIQYCFD